MCQCSPGFYDAGNGDPNCLAGTMSQCHYSCATCNGGLSNNCLSCNDANTKRYLTANTCACINDNTHFDYGDTICQ